MRYQKGTIDINRAHDEPILTWVLQCGFISTGQLWRFLTLEGLRLPRRSFSWRLQRLVEHGLIRQWKIPIVAREAVYSIDALGVAHMMGRGEYCAGARDRFENGNENTAILHALDLNEIRLTLEESGVLSRWRSDTEIRAQNEFTTFGYAKDYDAVVTVCLDGYESEFALEYERTPKAAKKYVEIRKAIDSETRIAMFLYVTVNFHVLNFVTQFFERSRKLVYFGMLEEFRVRRVDMRVMDGTRRHTYLLKDLLTAGSHQPAVARPALPAK
jgi:Replication-relaxation